MFIFNVHTLSPLEMIAFSRKERRDTQQTIAQTVQLTNKLLLYIQPFLSLIFKVYIFMFVTSDAPWFLQCHCCNVRTLCIWSLYCQNANLHNALWTFERLYCSTSLKSTHLPSKSQNIFTKCHEVSVNLQTNHLFSYGDESQKESKWHEWKELEKCQLRQ